MISPSAKIRFRHFVRKDQSQVRTLILAGLGDHFPELDLGLNPDLNDIAASYIARGHVFIVGEIDGTIAAAGALIALQGDLGRIARVSVAADWRRQGLGKATVDHLLTLARQIGYRRLLVETNHDWSAAIALYGCCGFREYDRDDESIHMQLILDGA